MKKFCSFAPLIVCALFVFPLSAFAQKAPEQDYLVYVLSESADKITLIRFGPQGARVEREFATGVMESDIDGPHGIAVWFLRRSQWSWPRRCSRSGAFQPA